MLKKNSRVLYILESALNDEIFNHVCYCEKAQDLWGKLTLLYEETSQENSNSLRRDNMLSNLSDTKEITYFSLTANEEVKDGDASANDDDDACIGDDEEEDEETEYDVPDEVYDSLHNYSKRKLIKVLLWYIRHQEGCISKIKDLKKKNFELSQENVEFRKSIDLVSNDLTSFQEKVVLLEKEKDELQVKCANLENIVLKFSKREVNLNKILGT